VHIIPVIDQMLKVLAEKHKREIGGQDRTTWHEYVAHSLIEMTSGKSYVKTVVGRSVK
jgi:hypothetical protein